MSLEEIWKEIRAIGRPGNAVRHLKSCKRKQYGETMKKWKAIKEKAKYTVDGKVDQQQ